MSWHRDEKINHTLIQLMDELCMWERETGRGSTFVLIPHYPSDGPEMKVLDGKPIQNEFIVPYQLILNASATRLKNEEIILCGEQRK